MCAHNVQNDGARGTNHLAMAASRAGAVYSTLAYHSDGRDIPIGA